MYFGKIKGKFLTISPECNEDNGRCVEGNPNFCLCHTGWQGDSCDECCPYWECPETNHTIACIVPNECRCSTEVADNDKTGLCNHPTMIKTP